MNFSMPPITWICLVIILVASIGRFVLVHKLKMLYLHIKQKKDENDAVKIEGGYGE